MSAQSHPIRAGRGDHAWTSCAMTPEWWMRRGCVSASDLALHFAVSGGTIRRWASQDGWTPHGTRRFRYWSMDDAQRSYDRHHPQHAETEAACA